jgi:type 1 glutamine amidotransferase
MTIDVLFIDGVHTHDTWPETSAVVRSHLARAGRFRVEHVRAPVPEEFSADFSAFAAVIPYYCPTPNPAREPAWPVATRSALDAYVRGGGGLVIIHAASNAFARWPEYNRMTGLGGWGARDTSAGVYLYLNERGQVVRSSEPGPAGHHEPEFEYTIDVRAPEHPIMRGMPRRWLHRRDEVYGFLRGPGEGIEVLATAFSGKTPDGTQRHEPVVMTIGYGKGRVFHTTLGHSSSALEGPGLRTLITRGTEWAASGAVTQPLAEGFPGEAAAALRPE